MELKNINSNGGNVEASILSNIKFFLLKIVKIELKNEYYVLFFLKDVMIAQKNSLYCSPH
jgi:hypothetical protein